MASYRTLRDIDWALLLLSLFICGLGVLQIYSATQGTKWQNAWWKQVVGLLLMWLVSSIDYHTLLGQVPLLYAGILVLLLLTFVVGTKVFGARRWIALPGGVLLQVSEFAKIVIVLMVARFLTELKTDAIHWRDLLKLIGLVGLHLPSHSRHGNLPGGLALAVCADSGACGGGVDSVELVFAERLSEEPD
jgi:rod shape determining protein RodA